MKEIVRVVGPGVLHYLRVLTFSSVESGWGEGVHPPVCFSQKKIKVVITVEAKE